MSDDGYDHTEVERRWQEAWDDASVYRTDDDVQDPTYVLGMYPYPSGELHMGHVRNYTITDAYARYRRMQGDDVLHPMGWDAFGLPAENAAKEHDSNPRDWTFDCIGTMRGQMEAMGFGYDWDREIATCEPDYYQWNQWLFSRFHDEGLVERRDAEVNWCPSCETVLADEQVEGEAELCWRCDTPVEQRELDQWFLKITEYADELLEDIDELEGWPDSVRQMQRNWIGRQEGTRLPFEISDGHGEVEAFTTRADTVFGATFFALAPGHEITQALMEEDEAVHEFVEHEADPEGDDPNGVATDLTATNPVTGEELPVFVADFVLSDVGTGALMGVPGHDERDHAFATKLGIDIQPVIAPSEDDVPDVSEGAYTEDGVVVNSGDYSGLPSEEARQRITEDTQGAEFHTQYRLRDWGISRQRYWGTPIPVVNCGDCGHVLVPDEDLPVELPEFINTTGNPLDAAEEWKQTTCPDCGNGATRETDTMDTFVDSSWYFLRYVSPDFDEAPFDVGRANDWMPVDQYVGGIEHAVMHLLYSRFFTKVLSDMEMVESREPFTNLLAQGMVQLEGTKMSKSKGNVVSPQAIVKEYGADTARLFTMQAAQPERDFDWDDQGVQSARAFLSRLYDLVNEFDSAAHSVRESPSDSRSPSDSHRESEDAAKQSSGEGTDPRERAAAAGEADEIAEYVASEIDATIATAATDFETLTFNTALRETRSLVGLLRRYREHTAVHGETFARGLSVAVRLLAPVTPHISEELWRALGNDEFVVDAPWPTPESDTSDYEQRRQLVENTQRDVRQIIDVAGIEDPSEIAIVVTPEWKYRALEIAVESDGPNVISEIMQEPAIREQGDAAASYGQDLQAEREALSMTLPPDTELATMRRAAWLFAEEFGAEVRVLTAEEAPEDVAKKAEPGRPAINID